MAYISTIFFAALTNVCTVKSYHEEDIIEILLYKATGIKPKPLGNGKDSFNSAEHA